MPPIANFQFTWPSGLYAALAIIIVAIAIAALRRIALPRASLVLIALGMILLALATGAPVYRGHKTPEIAVMIDVSPSTRGAAYYQSERFRQRIAELLGTRSFRTYAFSESLEEVNPQQPLVERAADGTNFAPPPVDAIVLFSDANFDLPATVPPIQVVVDPLLERAADGAVTRMSINNDDVTIAVRNHVDATSTPRYLQLEGLLPSASMPTGETLGHGEFIFHASRDPNLRTIVARVMGQDRWPENDEMRIFAPPLSSIERWWIGAGRPPPDAGWQAIPPDSLPLEAAAYLAPSVILLDNVPADAIAPAAQQRIAQYVRDLGGSLIIIGGENSFGAGGYFGTTLESLSPLSSAPPAPTRHWIFLADSSGSMAGTLPGNSQTKWQHAVEAMLRALPSIPPNDLVTIGSFARDVRWWSTSRTAAETRQLNLPPPDVTPNGPTNLQPALEQIAPRGSEMPTEFLILSDADAAITDTEDLARKLTSAKIRVHLLATGADPPADNPVSRIVRATGGQQFRESDPTRWSSRVKELLRATMPELLARGMGTLTFDPSANLPPRDVELWNRTWPKPETELLATIFGNGNATAGGAQWNLGAGQAVALAFPATSQEISALANQAERMPRDPRFSVRREEGADLKITIDAIEQDRYLNGLPLQLMLRDDSSSAPITVPFTQAAPGRYELSTPAPRTSKLATIVQDGRVIERFALAGRYPREFDAIGNDRDAMRELARRTGGRVIEPADAQTLDIKGPTRNIALTSELAFAGAALIAIGLLHWRRMT
ncbi:MAG: hypothetical protein H7Z14_10650 [Anaerolineae bacterium]|nr:hypothetical protein [Phycisphaerae bacterium]